MQPAVNPALPAKRSADGGAGYVVRTLIALDRLAARSMTPGELAEVLGVNRRTAVRLMEVMTSAGWAEPEAENPGRFQLTPRIVTRAGELMARSNLVRVAAPIVRRLRDQLDESSHLAVPARGAVIQVLDEPSSQPLAVTMRMGERVPIYCSAIGKAVAAFRPDVVEAALVMGLSGFTPNTRVTPVALYSELENVRALGYAIDNEEMYAGTRCIAAPVRTGLGEVVAAIGISGPTVRLLPERVAEYAAVVLNAASALSAALGYMPDGQADAVQDAQFSDVFVSGGARPARVG
jgi:IclR family acetate operon transcriptional repressor